MNTRVQIAAAVLATGAVVTAAAVAATHANDRQSPRGSATGAPKPMRKVEPHTKFGRSVTVRQVDRRRGLIYELEGSEALDSGVRIILAAHAPKATRDALLTRPLAATCHVPGADVHEFPGRWNAQFKQFGTALTTDDPSIIVAEQATDCVLYVGRQGDTPETASFDDSPFSRVSMK